MQLLVKCHPKQITKSEVMTLGNLYIIHLNGPLQIAKPNAELTPKLLKVPLQRNAPNSHARETHKYRKFDELGNSPVIMSSLEVLQMCPSQWKDLVSSLGVVDPSHDKLVFFYINKVKSFCIPLPVAFQVLVSIRNVIINRCIIDEGTSTCVMST